MGVRKPRKGGVRGNPRGIDFLDPVLGPRDRKMARDYMQMFEREIAEGNRKTGNYARGMKWAAENVRRQIPSIRAEGYDTSEYGAGADYLNAVARYFTKHNTDRLPVGNPPEILAPLLEGVATGTGLGIAAGVTAPFAMDLVDRIRGKRGKRNPKAKKQKQYYIAGPDAMGHYHLYKQKYSKYNDVNYPFMFSFDLFLTIEQFE